MFTNKGDLIHYSHAPFQTLCGTGSENQNRTVLLENVTCERCRYRAWILYKDKLEAAELVRQLKPFFSSAVINTLAPILKQQGWVD